MSIKGLCLTAAVTLLCGCDSLKVYDSDFSCNESIGKPVCKPATEIYADSLGNKLPYQQENKAKEEEEGGGDAVDDEETEPKKSGIRTFFARFKKADPAEVHTTHVSTESARQDYTPPESAYASYEAEAPIPVRKRPIVMRVYIAPWEDENNRLLMPQYVYQEIDKSTWNVGNERDPLGTPQIPAATIREDVQMNSANADTNRKRPVANKTPFGKAQGYEKVNQ